MGLDAREGGGQGEGEIKDEFAIGNSSMRAALVPLSVLQGIGAAVALGYARSGADLILAGGRERVRHAGAARASRQLRQQRAGMLHAHTYSVV